jgi:hypothetical protein
MIQLWTVPAGNPIKNPGRVMDLDRVRVVCALGGVKVFSDPQNSGGGRMMARMLSDLSFLGF